MNYKEMAEALRRFGAVTQDEAADAIETLVAERDELKAELDIARDFATMESKLAFAITAERDALRAHALTEAAQLCRDKAQHDYTHVAQARKDSPEYLRRITMGNRCDDCAQDIEALRDKTTDSPCSSE